MTDADRERPLPGLRLSLGDREAPVVLLAGPELAEEAVDAPLVRYDLDEGGWFVASRDRALLHLPEDVTVLVEGGRLVQVWIHPRGDPAVVAPLLDATVLALVLAQRGVFALHANAVEVDGHAVLIAGDRGAGKSTTTARLMSLGHRVLADDICPVEVVRDRVRVTPTGRALRLAPDAVSALGIDTGAATWDPVAGKHVFRRSPGDSATVTDLVVLRVDATAGAPQVEPCSGLAALAQVEGQLYRPEFVRPGRVGDTFHWAAATADRIRVHEVRRPSVGWSVDAVADAVLACARSGRGLPSACDDLRGAER